MTFPAVAVDSDPDPTTQMTWPTARPRQASLTQGELTADPARRDEGSAGGVPEGIAKNGTSSGESATGRLSMWNLFTLSISMAGAQIAWTVELG